MQKRINEQEDEAIQYMRAPEQVERLTKDVLALRDDRDSLIQKLKDAEKNSGLGVEERLSFEVRSTAGCVIALRHPGPGFSKACVWIFLEGSNVECRM